MQNGLRKDNEKVARQLKSEPKTVSKRMVSTEISRGAEDDVEYQHHFHTLECSGGAYRRKHVREGQLPVKTEVLPHHQT